MERTDEEEQGVRGKKKRGKKGKREGEGKNMEMDGEEDHEKRCIE